MTIFVNTCHQKKKKNAKEEQNQQGATKLFKLPISNVKYLNQYAYEKMLIAWLLLLLEWRLLFSFYENQNEFPFVRPSDSTAFYRANLHPINFQFLHYEKFCQRNCFMSMSHVKWQKLRARSDTDKMYPMYKKKSEWHYYTDDTISITEVCRVNERPCREKYCALKERI